MDGELELELEPDVVTNDVELDPNDVTDEELEPEGVVMIE